VRLAFRETPFYNSNPSFLETSMSANRSVDRSAVTHQKDRSCLCTFTFADGRQCRTPRSAGHPHLCAFHARKEAHSLAAEEAGRDISAFLSGSYLSACDLSCALGRLFSAVAQGQLKPKTATTLAYLGQTLVQAIQLAENEYINAFGSDSWRTTIRSSFAPPPALPDTACSRTPGTAKSDPQPIF
jgi:hypothetical protein